ncbi:MAG: hypothetical protein GX549_02150 [Clostridiales bacterium]|nr:hypothetical protein [Clostridiales bacterium]
MKKFRFTLEAVLACERRREKNDIAALAAVRAHIREKLNLREQLGRQIDALEARAAESTAGDLRERAGFTQWLIQDRIRLADEADALRTDEQACLAALHETRKRVRMLEKVRETQLAQYESSLGRQQDREMEEITARYMRYHHG